MSDLYIVRLKWKDGTTTYAGKDGWNFSDTEPQWAGAKASARGKAIYARRKATKCVDRIHCIKPRRIGTSRFNSC